MSRYLGSTICGVPIHQDGIRWFSTGKHLCINCTSLVSSKQSDPLNEQRLFSCHLNCEFFALNTCNTNVCIYMCTFTHI